MANRAIRRLAAVGISWVSVALMPLESFADSLMMTTWYPAPYGVYSQLRSTGNSYFAYQGGNVGVGTASPSAKLSIQGPGTGPELAFGVKNSNGDGIFGVQDTGLVQMFGGSDIRLLLGTAGTIGNFAHIKWDPSLAALFIYGDSTRPVILQPTPASGGSGGNVGIGTITPPAYPLHVFTPVANTNVGWFESSDINTRITIKSASGQWDLISMAETGNKFEFYNPTGAGYVMSLMKDGSVDIGQTRYTWGYKLAVEGTAANSTGVWATLSDVRLKKDIKPLTGGLSILRKLRPVTFHWKDEKKDKESGLTRGFIAQEVEQVVPDWVRTDSDGRKWLQTVGINAVTVDAIKELESKNDLQQKEIDALKLKTAELEEVIRAIKSSPAMRGSKE